MPVAPPIIPVIVGPTAGGKSSLALALARRLAPSELISADAFQVYRHLDIGTAKPTAAERAAVPHHLVDLIDPGEPFTVHDWLGHADRVTADIVNRARTPIVAGGTNLYVKAYCEGLFAGPEPDPALRAQLASIPQPERRAELARVDPAAAERIDPADHRRTIRALEIFRQTGTPISDLQQQWDRDKNLRPGVRVIGLDWPTDAINRRINARVRTMIEQGLVEEARALWQTNQLGPQAGEAIGYKQLIVHFENRCTLDDAIERIKIDTRRFAKNQRTWLKRFRSMPGAIWLDAEGRPTEQLCDRVLDRIANS